MKKYIEHIIWFTPELVSLVALPFNACLTGIVAGIQATEDVVYGHFRSLYGNLVSGPNPDEMMYDLGCECGIGGCKGKKGVVN